MNEENSTPQLSLGKSPKTKDEISLPVNSLKKHIAIFGQSGSGKTVACKIVIEEAVRNDIPAIIIDPQGDISSLALVEDWEKLEKYGISKDFYEEYKHKIETVIFTPASEKGVPLSINPLITPPEELDREEIILAIDGIATNLVNVLGYRLGSNKGKAVKAYLTALFQEFMDKNILVQDFHMLIDLIQSDDAYLSDSYRTLLSDRDKEKLVNNIKFLTVGAQSLVFNLGPKLSIPSLIEPTNEGKIRIAIIYLNTLTTQKLKNLYISTVSQQLYTYMLSHPSDDPQLIFYIDELAGLIPPYPRNPPTKKWLQLLFKQGRKYGVSMLVATQNISDVDYKAFGQVSTFFFGRFMAPQDLRTVEKMIQSHPSARFIIDDLPNFEPGEFYLLSPDNFKLPVRFKTRWLYTAHRALSDDDVAKMYKNPPPSLCKVVGDYNYDIDSLDFKDMEKELSLNDIEGELEKLHDLQKADALLDKQAKLDKLEDFPTPESYEGKADQKIGKEITDVDFEYQEVKKEKPEKIERIDLTKLVQSMKDQFLKYEGVDFKQLLDNFFGDTKFSYLGTNHLQLAYVPFLLLDFRISAKRTIEVKVAEKIKNEEVTLDLPIKRLFPLVDKLELRNDKKIWGLDHIPIQAEEVFEELLSILPLKNLGSLYSPPSNNIERIEIQRKPKTILESFQDVLLNDQGLYISEWKKDIEDEFIRIEEKYHSEIDSWVKKLENERDSIFAEIQEKRQKVKKFQAQIEEAKGIYASLKPIMQDKYKYKREADVAQYNKAVESLKYGPQVIKNYVQKIEEQIAQIKQIDKKIKAFPKISYHGNVDELINQRSFCIPKKDEIKDIYAAVVHIPISIAEINIINENGTELLIRGVAESALGTNITILCDTCLEKKSTKMQLVTIPNLCTVCGRTLCPDHSIECSLSSNLICNKHAVVCSTCKDVISTQYSHHCDFCENIVCSSHLVQCDECQKVICQKHSKKVKKKGLFKSEMVYVCPDHR